MIIGNQMDLYREILADYAPPPTDDALRMKAELEQKLENGKRRLEKSRGKLNYKNIQDQIKELQEELKELKKNAFPGHGVRNVHSFAWQFEKKIGEERARLLAEKGDGEDSGQERATEYVRLRALILRYEEGKLSKEEYFQKLRELTGSMPSDCTEEARLAFQEHWEEKLLGDMVSDFLNPLRRKLRLYEDGKQSAGQGYVDDVRLLSEFQLCKAQQKGSMIGKTEESGSVGQSIGGPSREDCERLFETVRWKKEAAALFVPLRIYPDTGSGVYLIGNDRLDNKDSSEGYCRICKLASFDLRFRLEYGISQFDISYNIEEFTSVGEALDALDREAIDPGRFEEFTNFNTWSIDEKQKTMAEKTKTMAEKTELMAEILKLMTEIPELMAETPELMAETPEFKAETLKLIAETLDIMGEELEILAEKPEILAEILLEILKTMSEIPDSFRRYFSWGVQTMDEKDRKKMEDAKKGLEAYRKSVEKQQKVSKVREVFGQSLPENPGRPRNKRS